MKKDEAAVDSAQQLSRGMILQSPQKIFSHSTFLRNLVGMVLLEVKYMKRSKAKIVKRKSMKREMVQVCLTKHQLARQKQRQKLNKPPISHDQITSLLSLSNNPDLFLETLSPLFAFDFVG